jgi:cation transport ATPase
MTGKQRLKAIHNLLKASSPLLTVMRLSEQYIPDQVKREQEISRRISRIAVQNIALSLGIKAAVLALGIALSCLGLEAPLGLAVVADVGASLLAVLNATRAAERKKQ